MPPHRCLTIALAVLLAGCSSPNDAAGETTPSVTTASMGSTGPAPPVEPSLPAPETATCDVVRTNAGTAVGLGVYIDRVLADTGCFFSELFGDPAWAGSALVEVEWSPGPSVLAADAWFESDQCVPSPAAPCDLPKATEASAPLVMTLEGDDFTGNIDANLQVQVAAQGAAVQQAFTVHITLFANATVDVGFSAIP